MSARILLVDDEPDAQELFRQNFRREIRKGVYDFDYAQSACEALEQLKSANSRKPVMVLSDINMPGMTGVELLDVLKRQWPEIPVFMITAYGDHVTERKVREKGAERLFAKPVDFTALKHELLTHSTGGNK